MKKNFKSKKENDSLLKKVFPRPVYIAPAFKGEKVNHPNWYNQGKIEVIDFIEDQKFDYVEGNVCKYLCRYKYKGVPGEDLKKARFYLDRLIARQGGVDEGM